MGPTLTDLDKLLAMPYGCGEQNMLKFAPNIYILQYLTKTNQLTKEIEERAKKYLISGNLSSLHSKQKIATFLTCYLHNPATDVDVVIESK